MTSENPSRKISIIQVNELFSLTPSLESIPQKKTYLSLLAKTSLKQAVFVHECAKDCSFFRSVTSILIVTDGVSSVMEFSDLAQF